MVRENKSALADTSDHCEHVGGLTQHPCALEPTHWFPSVPSNFCTQLTSRKDIGSAVNAHDVGARPAGSTELVTCRWQTRNVAGPCLVQWGRLLGEVLHCRAFVSVATLVPIYDSRVLLHKRSAFRNNVERPRRFLGSFDFCEAVSLLGCSVLVYTMHLTF